MSEGLPSRQLPEQQNEQSTVQVFTPPRSIVAATRVALGYDTEFDPPRDTLDGTVISNIIPGSD